MDRVRIYLTGRGPGHAYSHHSFVPHCFRAGYEVVSGEIHGMAQRGGVVESTILLGGFASPRISLGEADILLGFEPMETLRALPYLRQGGYVFSSLDPLQPVSVSAGAETYPDLAKIRQTVGGVASQVWFLPLP